MRAKRTDNNQKSIVNSLRQIPGITVHPIHMVADGMGDIIVGSKGKNYIFEIKDPSQPPSKRKLTPAEENFHARWTGQIDIVETIEDVLKIIQCQ
jgi:hypothetical protein